MLENSNTFNSVEIATNNMFSLIRFFFLGKYTSREYEYTFYLNGEEFKADDCFSNRFGKTYCELDGVRYNNVEYTRTLVAEYEKSDFFIGPIIAYSCLFFVLFKIIWDLFFGFRCS